jgi:nicotinamidase-related amidase
MLLDVSLSQLVLVDYQTRLMPDIYEGAQALANGLRLGQAARLLGVPTWGTEQNPSGLGPNPPEIRALCKDTLVKMHFSAVEEGLGEWLRPEPQSPQGNARSLPKHLQKAVPQVVQRNSIVMSGWEAHVCLMQTALDLLEDEFEVWVVTDACSSRTERNRDAAFDRLAGAGAELVTTEMVLFEWLRTAEHAQFKEVLALVK